ncbi:hypothetical protein DACRYDRAFT_18214 [Dacryopinax primogenitus]|uniref:Uncharacterized protein n=1 Tax=Dacryopinax primogenitus (strain DJM 731) TaxID=1858805 RepID=M5G2Y3_DACPD|nr:uncharacterized protein DACRYDRAFT_18214 [Dacryopinax primogenitus]EJT98122.1 hypothetical protein DACRYDRAFT_18214 [Dacryopinax primogenitus]
MSLHSQPAPLQPIRTPHYQLNNHGITYNPSWIALSPYPLLDLYGFLETSLANNDTPAPSLTANGEPASNPSTKSEHTRKFENWHLSLITSRKFETEYWTLKQWLEARIKVMPYFLDKQATESFSYSEEDEAKMAYMNLHQPVREALNSVLRCAGSTWRVEWKAEVTTDGGRSDQLLVALRKDVRYQSNYDWKECSRHRANPAPTQYALCIVEDKV